MNRYVDFISDEDFIDCVKKVVNSYPNENEYSNPSIILKESKNTVDEFKTIFDLLVNKMTFDEWSKNEIKRQRDKTINNKIGEFHQELLGKVDGWIDLGTGHVSGMDLKKEDDSIFIELKNKFNTMNSSSTDNTRSKLEKTIELYPDAVVYWAVIVDKNYKSEESIWVHKDKQDDRIKRISGSKVYELITGDSNALKKTFDALILAISDLQNSPYEFTEKDYKILEDYKKYVFED